MKIIKDGQLIEGKQVGNTIVSGRKTVSAAGTAETLGSSTKLTQGVIITALASNTGDVYVGDSNVDKTTSKQNQLVAGQATAIGIDDISKVYVDADTNDEGVSYIGA